MPILASSTDIPITGVVTSRCVIYTETAGVYGNPSPGLLSTLPTDGGVEPLVRYDVVQGGFYKASITTPTSFSSSPQLTDNVVWTGVVNVARVSDSNMSVYSTNKRVFGNTTEVDLKLPGSVWFSADSTATYGYNKAYPAGTYTAIVTASCIAI